MPSLLEVKYVIASVRPQAGESLDALADELDLALLSLQEDEVDGVDVDVYNGAVHCDAKCNYDPVPCAQHLRFLQQLSSVLHERNIVVNMESLREPILLAHGRFEPPALESVLGRFEQELATTKRTVTEGELPFVEADPPRTIERRVASAEVRAILRGDELQSYAFHLTCGSPEALRRAAAPTSEAWLARGEVITQHEIAGLDVALLRTPRARVSHRLGVRDGESLRFGPRWRGLYTRIVLAGLARRRVIVSTELDGEAALLDVSLDDFAIRRMAGGSSYQATTSRDGESSFFVVTPPTDFKAPNAKRDALWCVRKDNDGECMINGRSFRTLHNASARGCFAIRDFESGESGGLALSAFVFDGDGMREHVCSRGSAFPVCAAFGPERMIVAEGDSLFVVSLGGERKHLRNVPGRVRALVTDAAGARYAAIASHDERVFVEVVDTASGSLAGMDLGGTSGAFGGAFVWCE